MAFAQVKRFNDLLTGAACRILDHEIQVRASAAARGRSRVENPVAAAFATGIYLNIA
jgi:hypothetical protein